PGEWLVPVLHQQATGALAFWPAVEHRRTWVLRADHPEHERGSERIRRVGPAAYSCAGRGVSVSSPSPPLHRLLAGTVHPATGREHGTAGSWREYQVHRLDPRTNAASPGRVRID